MTKRKEKEKEGGGAGNAKGRPKFFPIIHYFPGPWTMDDNIIQKEKHENALIRNGDDGPDQEQSINWVSLAFFRRSYASL